MRQLRDYEKKLRAKRSQTGIHKIGDPLVAGMAMPDLVYGSEESEDNPDELKSLEEIKPRPKPRIPKFKPAEVRLCCAEVFIVETAIHEMPDPAEMPTAPPNKKFKRSKKVANTAITAANIKPASKFQTVHATLSVAEFAHVAEVRSDTPLIDHGEIGAPAAAQVSNTWSPSSSFKKRLPFTKITEPAKIAVSFFVLPLCSSSTCLTVDCSLQLLPTTFNTGISVFAADSHGQLAQVLEEILLECAIGGDAKTITADIAERVEVSVVTNTANIAVVTQTHHIYECPGVYRYQKMDELAALPNISCAAAAANLPGQQNPPMLPRGPPQRLQRNSATRLSIKVPGLNIRPAPEKHKKRPQFIDPDFFSVVSCQLPAVLFERATANIGRFRQKDNSAGATVVLYSPEFSTPVSTEVIIMETSNVFVKSINLISLSALPSRKLVMTSNLIPVTRHPQMLSTEKGLPIFVLPSREYPYYARVPRAASEAVEKVKFAATVETTWFFPLKARPSTKAVRLAKSERAACKLIEELPALQWAAERSEIDIDTRWRETRPLPDDCRDWQVALKIRNLVERFAAVTEIIFKPELVEGVARYSPPEAYNSWSVMRMCAYPLFVTAVNDSPTVLVMNNTYCEPRPFTAKARSLNALSKIFEGFVAEKQEVRVCHDSVELAEIPDVVGDIQDIKKKLVSQSDPAKVAIWIEVFKRSVLRARPVYPFVVITETLPTPTVSIVEVFFEDAGAIPMKNIIETSVIVDRSFMARARPVVFHAVIVDLAHYGNKVINDLQLEEVAEMKVGGKAVLPPMQKASENRDYIRNYAELQWNQPMETFLSFSGEKTGANPASSLKCFAQTILVAPIGGIASVDHPVCEAVAAEFTRSAIGLISRSPFSLISKLLLVAESNLQRMLQHERVLPIYEFVQDIEDQASVLRQDAGCRERIDWISPPVDVLWFFQVGKDSLVILLTC